MRYRKSNIILEGLTQKIEERAVKRDITSIVQNLKAGDTVWIGNHSMIEKNRDNSWTSYGIEDDNEDDIFTVKEVDLINNLSTTKMKYVIKRKDGTVVKESAKGVALELQDTIDLFEKKKCKKKDAKAIEEAKVYDVQALVRFAGNVLSNQFNMKDVRFNTVEVENDTFFIETTFKSEHKLNPTFCEKLAVELDSNYDIPRSNTGYGFTVNVVKQDVLEDETGYLITTEIYN